MSPAQVPSSSAASPTPGRSLGWLIAGVALLSFGGMLLLMALAFARDLQSLQDAPALLWSTLCGQPVQSDLTLPVLLAAGLCAVLAGAIALVIGRARR